MKLLYIVLAVSVLLIFSGCNESSSDDGVSGQTKVQTKAQIQMQGQQPCLYVVDRVHIIGLTAIEPDPDNRSSSVISTYVSLLDQFDSSVKVPAVFRFELYEYVPRSSQPRGKRLYSWPELDLSDAAVNNGYWKDFLRAYNFYLDAAIDPGLPRTYILQVTCVTADEKRLTDIFYLNEKKK